MKLAYKLKISLHFQLKVWSLISYTIDIRAIYFLSKSCFLDLKKPRIYICTFKRSRRFLWFSLRFKFKWNIVSFFFKIKLLKQLLHVLVNKIFMYIFISITLSHYLFYSVLVSDYTIWLNTITWNTCRYKINSERNLKSER